MPTLGQVLRSPGLDLRMVVDAGGDPTVRWVAVSELADPTPFLEGGEIVLTTGLATAGWGDEWAAYAARLAAAGVAALGFGLGLTHARLPHGLREAARAVDLTVFTVPRAVPFVAVTRTVARLVQQEEEQALRAALAVQRRLARDAIGDDGVPCRIAQARGHRRRRRGGVRRRRHGPGPVGSVAARHRARSGARAHRPATTRGPAHLAHRHRSGRQHARAAARPDRPSDRLPRALRRRPVGRGRAQRHRDRRHPAVARGGPPGRRAAHRPRAARRSRRPAPARPARTRPGAAQDARRRCRAPARRAVPRAARPGPHPHAGRVSILITASRRFRHAGLPRERRPGRRVNGTRPATARRATDSGPADDRPGRHADKPGALGRRRPGGPTRGRRAGR